MISDIEQQINEELEHRRRINEGILQRRVEYFKKQTKENILHQFCSEVKDYGGGYLIGVVSYGEMNDAGKTPEMIALLQYLPDLIRLVTKLPRDKYQFSEIVELFAECCIANQPSNFDSFEQLCLEPLGVHDLKMRNEVACFLGDLQDRLRAAIYRYKAVDMARETEDSISEYTNYIDDLLAHYSKLTFVRLDFLYRSDLEEEIELETLELHLAKLHNNKRKNSIFNNLCGYITRSGYSIEKKLYVKVLFFFDGNLHSNMSDDALAEKIGGYWIKSITKRMGEYFNHNAYMQFQEHGLGLIEQGDVKKRKDLINIIRELCRKDTQIIKPHGTPHKRLLNRGQFPTKSRGNEL